MVTILEIEIVKNRAQRFADELMANNSADRAGRLEQSVMPCIPFHNGIICISPRYRLRLLDGRYVFMDWHSFCGPSFFQDRCLTRPIDNWWEDQMLCRAVEWFQERGWKA